MAKMHDEPRPTYDSSLLVKGRNHYLSACIHPHHCSLVLTHGYLHSYSCRVPELAFLSSFVGWLNIFGKQSKPSPLMIESFILPCMAYGE